VKSTFGIVVEGLFWGALLFLVYLLMEDVKLNEPWKAEERLALTLAAGLIAFGVLVS